MKTLYTPVLALALLGWFAPSAMAQERIPVTQCATSLVQVSQPRSGLEAEPPDLGGEG